MKNTKTGPNDGMMHRPGMVVALKPNHSATAEELLNFCQGRLAKYKIPRRIEFVESLPYSPYGKVMKAELRRTFVESSAERRTNA